MKNDMKERIIREAVDIAAFEGIDKLTMSYLAERTDLAKASLYHYFRTKEEILETVYQRGHRSLMSNGFRIRLDKGEHEVLKDAARHWKKLFSSDEDVPFLRMVFANRFTDQRASEEYNALILMLRSQSDVILQKHGAFISLLFSSLLLSELTGLLEGTDADLEKSAEDFSALLESHSL